MKSMNRDAINELADVIENTDDFNFYSWQHCIGGHALRHWEGCTPRCPAPRDTLSALALNSVEHTPEEFDPWVQKLVVSSRLGLRQATTAALLLGFTEKKWWQFWRKGGLRGGITQEQCVRVLRNLPRLGRVDWGAAA